MNTLADRIPDAKLATPPRDASSPPAAAGGALNAREGMSIWIFWGFFATLSFLNSLFNDATSAQSHHLPAIAPLTAALADSLIWACITPVIFKLTSRYSLDQPRWLLSLMMLVALGIVISIVVARFMAWLRLEQSLYFAPQASDFIVGLDASRSSSVSRNWYLNEFVIYLVVLAAGFAHDYFVRYRQRTEQTRLLETQAMQLRADLAETRLELLRSRLDPHFLFNTLNTVSSLTEEDPRTARRMISQLSALLRSSLEDSREREVTLRRELDFLRRYIDIMQTRFQGRLNVIEHIDPDVLPAMVPSMVLQPLVENAIKHGVAKLDGMGRIEIHAHRAGSQLQLQVSDNGGTGRDQQRRNQEHAGTGIGLHTTRARLSHSYGEQQTLRINDNESGGVTVEILIPLHTTRIAPAGAA